MSDINKSSDEFFGGGSGESVARLTSIWEQHGRVILGAVAALVVAGGLYFLYSQSAVKAENAASEKAGAANLMFWQGDYERSKTTALEVAKSAGSTESGKDAHRIAGDAMYWQGDFKGAIAEYKKYLDAKGSGLISDSVRRSLAYSYESSRQFDEASKLYDQLVGKFERESSGEFLAASARCQMALGHKDEAAKRLQRLLDEFGDTSYAGRARVMLAGLQPNH